MRPGLLDGAQGPEGCALRRGRREGAAWTLRTPVFFGGGACAPLFLSGGFLPYIDREVGRIRLLVSGSGFKLSCWRRTEIPSPRRKVAVPAPASWGRVRVEGGGAAGCGAGSGGAWCPLQPGFKDERNRCWAATLCARRVNAAPTVCAGTSRGAGTTWRCTHSFTTGLSLGSSAAELPWDGGADRLVPQDVAFGARTSRLTSLILLLKAKHCVSSR